MALAITGAGGNHTESRRRASFFIMTVLGRFAEFGGRCEGSAGGRKKFLFFKQPGEWQIFAFCSDGKRARPSFWKTGDGSFIEKTGTGRQAGWDYQGLAENSFFLIQGKEPFSVTG